MLFRSFLQTAPLHLGKILQGQNQKHDLKLMAASIHPITVEPDMQLSWGIGCILMHKPSGNVWWTGSQPRGTYDIGSSSPSCTVHSVYNDKGCKMIQMDTNGLSLAKTLRQLCPLRPHPHHQASQGINLPVFFLSQSQMKKLLLANKNTPNIPNQSQF